MKYLLTGGGTGGHVYPALAIAEEIRQQHEDAEFLYVGRRDKLESWVVPAHGYPIRFVRANPFPRMGSPLALLRFMLTLWVGIVQAALILLRYRPQVIIGTGGYVSAPILFAYGALAKVGLSRARVFLYEPNAHPGLLNQVVGRLAQRIGVAFEQAGRWFDMKRVAIVGYPVRQSFLRLDPQGARAKLGIAAGRKVILVFGGSGGARVINEAVIEALPLWREAGNLTVIHISGRYKGPDYDAVAETQAALTALGVGAEADWYRRYDYADQMDEMVAAADLVICRGGMGTLTELGVSGTPALIVPLPTSAEDHQAINAREMERMGAALVLYQEASWESAQIHSRLDGEKMAQQVLELCADEQRLQAMGQAAKAIPRRNSLELIMDELDSLVAGQRPPPLSLEFPQAHRGLPVDPNALMRWVQARVGEVGGVEAMEPCELAYLRYQADRLLVSEGWYEIPLGRRNVGIKLIGVLHYWQRLPLLLQVLGDRTPIGRLARLCGGDFRHAGILRRNAVEHGIRRLGAADPETQVALLAALAGDPYFEVRAWAAQALGEQFAVDDAIENGLCSALDDPAPEVVIQALYALGKISRGVDLLERLRRFYLHPNWQFRYGVVNALIDFLRRGVLQPEQLEHDLDQVLASTPYFKPEFTLNERLRELSELAHPDPTKAPGGAVKRLAASQR
jgi:UDP-N-acetylglucosamine--N-acetylmuramyl-(pentapeptide) pyrophosphoryl-undecaprenol N-acetylglucosamine transferase